MIRVQKIHSADFVDSAWGMVSIYRNLRIFGGDFGFRWRFSAEFEIFLVAILGFGGDFRRILEIFGGYFGKMTYICSVNLMIAIAMCILNVKFCVIFDFE